MAEKTIDDAINEFADALVKAGVPNEVIADKFLSLGSGIYQTVTGTAATAA